MTRVTNLLLALSLAAGAACSGDSPAPTRAPDAAAPITLPILSPPSAPQTAATLISCPTATTRSVSGLIGPLGGILALGNTRVIIPLSAVLFPKQFTLTIPASNYAEIEVNAGGVNHYLFQLPVVMAIDYSRCDQSALNQPLSVWNIDPDSKELLERMIGVDEKLTHTIVFTTIHLSGYAVAD